MLKIIKIALEKMDYLRRWTWKQCYDLALEKMKEMGFDIRRGQSISDWHLLFRRFHECFPNPAVL